MNRSICRYSSLPVLLLALVCSHSSGEDPKTEKKPAPPSFQNDILPIFRAKCIRCHAGVSPKGGLNLTQPSSFLRGGKSGAAIRINAAEFSLLYEKISSNQMPKGGPPLTAKEKGLIRTWINEGAKGVDPSKGIVEAGEDVTIDHWAFKPPERSSPPAVNDRHLIRNPIDAFIVHELEKSKLTLNTRANRVVLIRRASFDLTGLPPHPEEVRRFLADSRNGAVDRMIERLLASPHYGERWARHWLDIAGYADSAGILSEDRPLPLMYRYRDYVIRAFNKDLPYDQFLQQQIAGDEASGYWQAFETEDRLPDQVVESVTATGFLRTAADPSRPDFTTIKNADAQYFYPTLFDTLQIVCSSTMGLTVQCARCHSHKFDPIPQVDYFRMQAVFMSAYRPKKWIPQMERRIRVATKSQIAAADKRNAEVAANVTKINETIAAKKKQQSNKLFETRLAKLKEDIRPKVKAAFAVEKDKRNDEQKKLVAAHKKQLRPEGKDLDTALAKTFPEFKKQVDKLKQQIANEQRRKILFDELRALYDTEGESRTPLLLRGDPLTPGPTVAPGVLSSIQTPEPFEWKAPQPKKAKSSGKRLAFARWLTQPQHPLTARVMVNRIWMHHFGRGLVATPADFGVAGEPPSHPELLDWLATEFVRSGWSVKHIHRVILNSSTWQQSSSVSAKQLARAKDIDPENQLLWRQRLRRLEAEAFRDAVLSASATTANQMFGYPTAVRRLGSGEVVASTGPGPHRRSIYIQVLRLNPESMLEAFDQPEIAINCTERAVSTVATQALSVLNSDSMEHAAAGFAERMLADAPDDVIDHAYITTLSRHPDTDEKELLQQFLLKQTERHKQADPKTAHLAYRRALADLGHMLFSCNEFVYVD